MTTRKLSDQSNEWIIDFLKRGLSEKRFDEVCKLLEIEINEDFEERLQKLEKEIG